MSHKRPLELVETEPKKKFKDYSLKEKCQSIFDNNEDLEFLTSLIESFRFYHGKVMDYDEMEQTQWEGIYFELSEKAMIPWLAKNGYGDRKNILRGWIIRNVGKNASDLIPQEFANLTFDAMYNRTSRLYCCTKGRLSVAIKERTNEELYKAGCPPWEIVAANTPIFRQKPV